MSEHGYTIVYVGTNTRGNDSKGIYICDLDMSTGELELLDHGPQVESPSYLAVHPNKQLLYACNSVGGPGQTGSLSAFSIDPGSGGLALLNQESTMDPGPCHVSVDQEGKVAMATNYSGGSVCMLPILADGRLAPATSFHKHTGSSVHPRRQNKPYAHSMWPDPSNNYALACDLGTDKVMIYTMDRAEGKLIPGRSPYARIQAGSGPRHLDFHPNGRWVYVVNEVASSVTLFDWDAEKGVLSEVQHIAAAPEDAPESNTGADIHVTPDGRYVYASNRDHNTLAMFSIDQETGKVTLIGYEPTQGDHPRNFCIDPTGTWLFCANMRTDNIVTYRIESSTGKLEPTGSQLEIPSPCCIKFL